MGIGKTYSQYKGECVMADMKRKYQTWFEFAETEEQAKEMCRDFDNSLNPYARKKYPAHYTPWSSKDGKEKLFIVWTVR